jgi:hypothetical protein
MNEIQPVLGDTQVYIFAYGQWKRSDSNESVFNLGTTARLKHLMDNGFKIFCGVGRQQFSFVDPTGSFAFMDRANIDGFSLHTSPASISRFMNASTVICNVERIVDYWTATGTARP